MLEEHKRKIKIELYNDNFQNRKVYNIPKANMKIVGAMEYAVVLYRDKLPKFNNPKKPDGSGTMIFNWFSWEKDKKDDNIPKIHPTQKPVRVLKKLIEIFTDEYDVVIDPCAGSFSTGRACQELNRNCYGFEIDKNFYKEAKEKMLNPNYLIEQENQKNQETGQISIFELLRGE